MNFKPPKGMRVGQAIYGFIYWLEESGIDIFYIPDVILPIYYKSYLRSLKKKNENTKKRKGNKKKNPVSWKQQLVLKRASH